MSEKETVNVWMSSTGQPGHVTLGDVDALQTIFGGKVNILVDSSLDFVRVYAEDPDTERELAKFMADHAPRIKSRPMSLCNL